MKFFKIIIFLFFISPASSNEVFKLKKITDLNNPWSLTFINEKEVLVGDKGGQIVAEGRPEDVALNPKSYTAHYLNELVFKKEISAAE